MDLVNLHEHKRNTNVLVDGTKYSIDGDGVCHGVPEEHAGKMLGSKAWQVWDGSSPADRLAAAKADAAERRQALHEKAVSMNKAKGIEALVDKRLKELGVFDAIQKMKKLTATSEVEVPPAASLDAPPPPADDEVSDPEMPGEGAAWPDPKAEYSREWLMACADAYEVKYTKNLGTEKLVERIKAAMYE